MTVKRVGVVFPKAAKKGDEKSEKAEEAGLAKVVVELQSVHKAIADEIASLLKSDPLPNSVKAVLGKLQTINASSRAPELKDLAKAMKGGTLRSNPGKIERVMNDLNDDVNRVNGVPEALTKAVEAAGKAAAVELLQEIVKSLPADVAPTQIALKEKMAAFIQRQSKAGWSSFATAAVKLKQDVAEDAAELQRLAELRKVNEGFRQTLRFSEREKLWKAAEADKKATAKSLGDDLAAALTEQECPNKGRWASYLDLGAGGSYTLKDGGSYAGFKIHVTMSKDSWTPAANGSVSLMSGSPEAVLKKLLDADDWKQMHATLEANKPNYPHVFLFAGVLGNDTRWAAARTALDKDAKWVTGAQKAMEAVLDTIKTRLKAKIAEAQKAHGANVY